MKFTGRKMDLVRKLSRKLIKPGDFFRYGSIQKRSLYVSISRKLRRSVLIARTQAYEVEYAQKKGLYEINPEIGYLSIDEIADRSLMDDVLEHAKTDLASHLLGVKDKQNKEYLQTVGQTRAIDLYHPYFKFALSKELISLVTGYFGFVPILSDLRLWYSPNDKDEIDGSQFFHLDYADVSQVKVFVLITDVDHDSGPTAVIDASSSRKICDSINYRLSNKDIRIPDEVIFSYINPTIVTTAVGKSGSLFIADTSRCLHYGSRYAKKPRAVLMLQYVSPFSFRFSLKYRNEAKFANFISEKNSAAINMLLGGD